MALKKIYTCDLCGMKRDPGCLRGVYFERSNLAFSLTKPEGVEEKHICTNCAKQMYYELVKIKSMLGIV